MKPLPAADGNEAAPLLVEPGRELDLLEKVCARLEAQNGTRLLTNALRTAGVAKLGAETLLVLPEGDVVNQRPFEEPRQKALAEEALAAELGLAQVQLRVERRAEAPANLLARDAEERRKLEKRWTSMARSVEGVRQALEMFGGRIESIEVEEEDGGTSRIRVEEEPQPEGAGR